METVDPRVVIIETHIELGDKPIVVPYDENFCISKTNPNYFGASAPAMLKLAKSKGYRLAGANRFGFNLIFVKGNEGIEYLPEINAESVLKHPRHLERIYDPKSLLEDTYIKV